MSCCGGCGCPKVTRDAVVFPSTPVLVPPEMGRTRLIVETSDKQRYFAHRECDTLTAVIRGLREYLEQVAIECGSGYESVFKAVHESAAYTEDRNDYPGATVSPAAEAEYYGSAMNAQIDRTKVCEDVPATSPGITRAFLSSATDLRASLSFDMASTTLEERAAVVAAVQNAMEPVTWTYGIRLELPHYHHARASYTPMGITFSQDPQKGLWLATMRVQARCPVIKVHFAPEAQVRVKVQVLDSGPSVR